MMYNSDSNLQKDLDRFYSLLNHLQDQCGGFRYLKSCDGTMNWPERGVYFFFEPGEFRQDQTTLRVVRVGTHAVSEGSKATLWNRLITHRGHASGGGNHRGSVFRLLVGSALITRGKYPDISIALWGMGNSASSEIRKTELEIEYDVSDYIGSMPFLWIKIDDPPGPESLRSYIERNAIGLLSVINSCPDVPSTQWLGHSCKKEDIRKSGLWNSNHVREKYDPGFLDLFERLINSSSNIPENKKRSGRELTPPSFKVENDTMDHQGFPWIATITLETNSFKFHDNDDKENRLKNEDRLITLETVTRDLAGRYSGPGVILLPGGFFHSGRERVAPCIESIQKSVSDFLKILDKIHSSPLVAVIGIDGNICLDEGEINRCDRDQVAIAVDKNGIIAFAKKFYPTNAIEAQHVDKARDYVSQESILGKTWSRIFCLGEKSFYIAVCYDTTGIKHFPKPKNVDYILALIHGFYLPQYHLTGNYQVRVFANASREWRCPVFGSVVFFERKIAEKWRTGISFRTWDKKLNNCKNDDNSLIPVFERKVGSDNGEAYTIALFDLSEIPPGKNETRNYPVKTGSGVEVKREFTAAQKNFGSQITKSELFEIVVSKIRHVFGNNILEQKTKLTVRVPNIVHYPNRREIDLLSIFKTCNPSQKGVKFLLYHHVLGLMLRTDVNQICNYLPRDFGKLKDDPGPAEQYVTGYFRDEKDIDTFLSGIRAIKEISSKKG